MPRKVYKIETTAGPRWSVGVFDGDQLLKGSSPRYYKTRKGAEKKLKQLNKDHPITIIKKRKK